ncbi:MAG: hypothetical protein JW913_11715 [Chitinispirillaceae bacterium]|nr:hypothetical protein [Chitinispirillaceae bacterium]
MKPLTLIVHNRISDNPTEDENDVIAQTKAVAAALDRLGWRVETLPLTLDLEKGRNLITSRAPDCIFNLVESLEGDDRFIASAPMLFESLHIPYTGSSPATLAATSNKCVAKKIMQATGIPTPRWQPIVVDSDPPAFFPFIIKSATDHASIGISDDSIITDASEWQRWIGCHGAERQRGLFAESYIHGREFNLSVLQRFGGAITVLPPAEIGFAGFPAGKPHIVGYAAKWDKDTFEYNNTPRLFSNDRADAALHERLIATARACWDLFSLAGYGRVDFRVDIGGKVHVLEINTNPCLTPDAGFVAACDQGGIDFDMIVKELVAVAFE